MTTGPLLAQALGHLRAGNLAAARLSVDAALAQGREVAPLQISAMIDARSGRLADAAAALREALALDPADAATRSNLVGMLIELGQPADAIALCREGLATSPDNLPLLTNLAYLLQSSGDDAAAIPAYRRVVALAPGDAQSWNNLGNSYRNTGDSGAAVAALEQAYRLQPDLVPVALNLVAALAAVGRADDALVVCTRLRGAYPGLAPARIEAARILRRVGRDREALDWLDAAGNDPGIMVERGLALVALGEHDGAAAAYRRALAVDRRCLPAYLNLASLLEHANRADEIDALLGDAVAAGIPAAELAYVRALALRRTGDLEAALALALQAPPSTEPSRRAQLIGELHDRLGHTEAAFAAFTAMNDSVSTPDTRAAAAAYRDDVARIAGTMTPAWARSWAPSAVERGRAPPVFLVGFPRSGTTLLDTILLGHPAVEVLEERPALEQAGMLLGNFADLASADAGTVERMRRRYWEVVDQFAPHADGRLIVDKMPLNLVRMALAYRLFPDARILFAQRHPCDVVLSCFITNFGINGAMSNFHTLPDAAQLYDLVMGIWADSRVLFPLAVHDVVYERLVDAPETEARAALDFLGLDWRAEILDHRTAAAARGYISSASYAQVTEPLYRRASGRWTRYRAQLAPVLGILEPWAKRLGYAV